MDRILIRKLIWNIFSEAQYINTMMEPADRTNPDSAIALSQEEIREIVILLSQADYLHDYLKEHEVSSEKDEINERSVKEIVQLLANNLISEETAYGMITNLLNANADTKPNTGTEEKTGERNEPLTWNELKEMIGKPVWVEVLSDEIDLSSRWMLVARETKAHSLPLAYTDDIGHWIFGHEDKLGKTWQAYRKEQK